MGMPYVLVSVVLQVEVSNTKENRKTTNTIQYTTIEDDDLIFVSIKK